MEYTQTRKPPCCDQGGGKGYRRLRRINRLISYRIKPLDTVKEI